MTLEKIMNTWVKDRLDQAKLSLMIVRRDRIWSAMIEEIIEGDGYGTSTQFTEAVNWSTETLKTWPDCTRMSYDTWYFKERYQADKFNTLFSLKWAR